MALVLHQKLHFLQAIAAGAGGASAVVRALLVAHCTSRWTALPLLYCCHYVQVKVNGPGNRAPALQLHTLLVQALMDGALTPEPHSRLPPTMAHTG